MAFSSGVVAGDELHAHGFGLLGEVVQDPLAVALLEVILPPVGVFLPVGEHGVDQSGQLVGSGRDGLGFVHARAHSPVVRTLAPTGSNAVPLPPTAAPGPRGWRSAWFCHP